jgi:hypothetical protein
LNQDPETEEEVYDSCLIDGYINEIPDINKEKVNTFLRDSNTCRESADILAKSLKQGDQKWSEVYRSYYNAIRMLAEAFLLSDKVVISSHKCIFSALCVKHPDLELDWNFFERVRAKVESMDSDSESVTYQDWKAIELQMKLYISALKKETEKRSSEI